MAFRYVQRRSFRTSAFDLVCTRFGGTHQPGYLASLSFALAGLALAARLNPCFLANAGYAPIGAIQGTYADGVVSVRALAELIGQGT